MGSTTGVIKIGDYTTPSGDPAKVQALLDLIPDPDSANSSGSIAQAAGQSAANTYLDEMSPAAATQLRVELIALKAAVT